MAFDLIDSLRKSASKSKFTATDSRGVKLTVDRIPEDLSEEGIDESFANTVALRGGFAFSLPKIVGPSGAAFSGSGTVGGLKAVEVIESALGLEPSPDRRASIPAALLGQAALPPPRK